MEFVQILERYEENGVKKAKWSKPFRLHVGFKENWVLDKTTDTAYVKFHYYDDETPQIGKYCKHPTWEVMDWCRILHVKDEKSVVAEYDGAGLPVNFGEYVISDIQANYVGKLHEWIINLKLEEPIVRAYGVLGETLTFTNQTTKTVDGHTYRREPYNHLTALERWLKVTPANCDDYSAGYDKTKNISWYNRITILDKDFLRNIPFADDTFNELNLYNVLLDNYDSSTGRTPVFYFDLDPATDLPRNPARDEYLLKFLRQDGADKPYLDPQILFNRMTAYQYAKSLSNYATGLASNVQNLSLSNAVKFPAQFLFTVPEVDTTGRDVTNYSTEGTDDWFIRTPFKIKKVTKIQRLRTYAYSSETSTAHIKSYYGKTIKDILINSQYILEEKEYRAANTDMSQDKNIFWYTEGNNKIFIKEYCYSKQTAEGKNNGIPLYYIEYEPYVDVRISVGNDDFVQQINQTSSQVDNVKYSKYMQSYLDGMNVPDLMICKAAESFDVIKDCIGRRVIIDDIEYLVTNVAYQNRNFIYDAVFQLNENHFRKNDSVKAPQTIRSSIAIATDNIKERQINYKQTVKIGLSSVNNNVSFDKKLLICGLIPNYDAKQPQSAVIELKYKDGTSKKFVTPTTIFTFGNQVNIAIAPFDNAIVGYEKFMDEEQAEERSTTNQFKYIYKFALTRYSKQTPLLFTDKWGEVERLSCNFATADDSIFAGLPPNSNRDKFEDFANGIKSLLNINDISVMQYLEKNAVLTVTNQQIQKDMMERMSVNYAFAIEGENCIVCDELPRQSRLFTAETSGGIQLAFAPRFLSETDKLDKVDGLTTINVSSTSAPQGQDSITYHFSGAPANYVSVAVVKNNKLLLIFNKIDDSIKEKIANGNLTIYF